jgi:hypothetical protein
MPDGECDYCGNPVALSATSCPHCGRPSLFPNVRAASAEVERAALSSRYRAAIDRAAARGCGEVVRAFETAARASKAVIARSLEETERLASSDNQLYSTYYKLIEAEVRLPSGDKWDKLRRLADAALFPLNERHIRFAALTLDEKGASYGESFLVLREDMIAHRASVFEDNSAIYLDKRGYDVPPGLRAPWEERAMLCVAKLAGQLQADTPPAHFAGVLLRQGATSEGDTFIEVHIWGSMTRRTLDEVVIAPHSRSLRPRKGRLKALRDRLTQAGVALKVG